jgi:hypothetical protein
VGNQVSFKHKAEVVFNYAFILIYNLHVIHWWMFTYVSNYSSLCD